MLYSFILSVLDNNNFSLLKNQPINFKVIYCYNILKTDYLILLISTI
jgi:hypothetical protein